MGLTPAEHEENMGIGLGEKSYVSEKDQEKYIFVPLLGLVVVDAMTEGDNIVCNSKKIR